MTTIALLLLAWIIGSVPAAFVVAKAIGRSDAITGVAGAADAGALPAVDQRRIAVEVA